MLFQRSLGAITTSAILAAGNTHAIVSSEVRRYDFAADITVTSGVSSRPSRSTTEQ